MSKTMAVFRARVSLLNCLKHVCPILTIRHSSSVPNATTNNWAAVPKSNTIARPIWPSDQDLFGNKETDRVDEALKQVTTMSELLETIREERKSIGEASILTALSKFADLRSEPNVDGTNERMELSFLCHRLIACSWKLEPGILVAVLHRLFRLNLSPKTVVVQTVLQLLRRNINHLTLRHVIRLTFILNDVETTPLIDAMRIALPLVFRNQLSMQTNKDDVQQLSEYFHYACQHGTPDRQLLTLAESLLAIDEKEWRARDAEFVLWGVASTKRDIRQFEQLADTVAKIFTKHTKEVDCKSLLLMMQRLLGKGYCNEELLTSIQQLALNDYWTFDQMHSLIQLYADSPCIPPIPFLRRYVAVVKEQIARDADSIPMAQVLDMCTRLELPDGDVLAEKLLGLATSRSIHDSWRHEPRRALQLAVNLELNHCSSAPVLPFVDVTRLLDDITATDFSTTLRDCLLLKALAKVNAWEERLNNMLRTNLVHYAKSIAKHKTDFPIKHALKTWFGDRYYVHTGYVSKDGIFVDQLLIEKKRHMKPVSDQDNNAGIFDYPNQSQFVEDVANLTPDSNPLAVLVCGNRSNRDWASRRILQKAGFAVMEVSLTSWNNLLEQERRPFLDRCLQEAYQGLQ